MRIVGIDVWNDSPRAARFEIKRGNETLIAGVVLAAEKTTLRREILDQGILRVWFGERRRLLPGYYHWAAPFNCDLIERYEQTRRRGAL